MIDFLKITKSIVVHFAHYALTASKWLTNLIERALVYNAHLLITDDLYQCMWCCNSFLSK